MADVFNVLSGVVKQLAVVSAAAFTQVGNEVEALKHPFSADGWKKYYADSQANLKTFADASTDIWSGVTDHVSRSFDSIAADWKILSGQAQATAKQAGVPIGKDKKPAIKFDPDPTGKAKKAVADLSTAYDALALASDRYAHSLTAQDAT